MNNIFITLSLTFLFSQFAIAEADCNASNVQKRLIGCAAIGDISKVKNIVLSGIGINYLIHLDTYTGEKWSPISAASYTGQQEVLKYLLSIGANPNLSEINTHRDTPVYKAILGGKAESIRILLSSGASPNLRNFLDDIIKFSDQRSYPKGLLEMFATLIEFDANIHNGTLLHSAAKIGNTGIMTILINAGVDINKKYENWTSQTALHVAVDARKTYAIDLLIKEGANLNSHPQGFTTPLIYALTDRSFTSYWGQYEDISLKLIAAGAKVNIITSYIPARANKTTALIEAAKSGMLKTVKALIKVNAPIYQFGTYTNPLLIASQRTYPSIVKEIILGAQQQSVDLCSIVKNNCSNSFIRAAASRTHPNSATSIVDTLKLIYSINPQKQWPLKKAFCKAQDNWSYVKKPVNEFLYSIGLKEKPNCLVIN